MVKVCTDLSGEVVNIASARLLLHKMEVGKDSTSPGVADGASEAKKMSFRRQGLIMQRSGKKAIWAWWGIVLAGVLAVASGCSDDWWEQEFFDPLTMHTYDFDGQPQIFAPEQVGFWDMTLGERRVETARVENRGRTTLTLEGLEVEGPFEVVSEAIADGGKALLPGESVVIEIAYEARDEERHHGLLLIDSDDPEVPRLPVELLATVDLPCPEAVILGRAMDADAMADPRGRLEGRPLEVVDLDASQSRATPGRVVERYEWSLIQTPQDTFVDLEFGPERVENALYLELSGVYVVELRVWDDRGTESCEPARMEIEAISGDAIHLQLVWDTPTDPDPHNGSGSDLDLHFLHEDGQWNRHPYDCHWLNPNPSWGHPLDSSMDPRLDIDRVDGWGPENINLEVPEPGVRYSVGVNYFSDHGYGQSFATVRIFIHGRLEREFIGKPMVDGEFWHVADIDWPTADIIARDRVSSGFPSL